MTVRALFRNMSAAPPRAGDEEFAPWDLHLEHPVEIVTAEQVGDVLPALARIEQAADNGLFAALALAYEAAPAFDPAMRLASPDPHGPPLLWAALFDAPAPLPSLPTRAQLPYNHGPWTPLVDREAYDKAVASIREHIRQGETYQANYTLPFACDFSGDPRAWWESLASALRPGFAAYLDMGRHKLLSLSPELFFRRAAGHIETRPMKGTLARGRWPEEDERQREKLLSCPKNRAENVMITDLLRSDLGRLALPGTVRVNQLCAVERYPTVWQMVSNVCAALPATTTLAELFTALFPCGSITGAPKIRTMDLLRELEPHPRGYYCGAVGWVRPGGECCFNVPIRTLTLDTKQGRARFGVGGGVTWDSTAEDEYRECLAKMRFLTRPASGFELLETLCLRRGRFAFLEGHLKRMANSADYFDFHLREEDLRRELGRLARALGSGRFLVRLLVDEHGTVRTEHRPLPVEPRRVRSLAWAPEPVDSSDVFLFHKTTRRAIYDRALAAHPGADDVLLRNERGEITESCRANLVVRLDGGLYTPALASGLLNGVFRQQLLRRGWVLERVLFPADLHRADALWLVNSVRGFMPATLKGTPEE